MPTYLIKFVRQVEEVAELEIDAEDYDSAYEEARVALDEASFDLDWGNAEILEESIGNVREVKEVKQGDR